MNKHETKDVLGTEKDERQRKGFPFLPYGQCYCAFCDCICEGWEFLATVPRGHCLTCHLNCLPWLLFGKRPG